MSIAQSKNKHSQNKYNFILSNGQNYWNLSKNVRCNINGKFRIKKKNEIIYRELKDV